MDAKRIINGTFGEAWLDGDKASETKGLQAKIDKKKEEVNLCGDPGTKTKMTGWTGKGTLKLYKTNSRLAIKMADDLRAGRDTKFTIISKLKDPDSWGAERIALKGVSFDDLTLVDWEAAKLGEVEAPFTFEDFEFLDLIDPQ